MIQITTETTNQAWRQAFTQLYDSGQETNNDRYFRDELMVISVTQPELEPIDPLFPMPQEDISLINHFITTGENEEQVVHEWTKLYFHRMFDRPHSQIEYFISKLQSSIPKGDALMSLWEKSVDQTADINPCTQVVWGRIKQGALELHVHAHSSDAYKKLLMNMQEFIAIQHYVAGRLNISVGPYYHILDSCHFHWKDVEAAKELRGKM